jgi:hypothetical protein
MRSRPNLSLPLFLLLLVAGCSQTSVQVQPVVLAGKGMGSVFGGQQPIANAVIQLYAVGTAGDGSAARPLLSKEVVTDGSGRFDLTGLYDCTGVSEVYVTAMGGEPSLNLSNPEIALMTALGACGSLTSATVIEVNELTTAAATNALSRYMRSATEVGSGVGDAGSLTAAFVLAGELVNTATGTAPGADVPTGYGVPVEEINTLADIVAACVNSAGGAAGDGSACGDFFLWTTPPNGAQPTNTVTALHDLALYPGLNSRSLFGLISAEPVFQPVLSEAPANFAVALETVVVDGPLSLTPAEITFPVTFLGSTSRGTTATLLNSGSSAVTLSSIGLAGVDAGDFVQTNNCPSVLAPAASCEIQTTFSPWDTTQRNATLQINSAALSATLSGKSSLPTWKDTLHAAQPLLYLSFDEPDGDFADSAGGAVFSTAGTIHPGQPGFDNTLPENMSAAFTAGSYLAATDPKTGDFEWSQPFSMVFHIDDLQYPQEGNMYLVSKGDVGGYHARWYELVLELTQGVAQLCFGVSGAGGIVAPYDVSEFVCSAAGTTAIPNGYNYDIVVSNDGTGSPSALQLYVNGVNDGIVRGTNGPRFGSVVAALNGTGMGYADSTPFSSVGGGKNCTVAGTMAAAGGVPTGITYTENWGCTSTPVLNLTAPTGTGTTLGAALYGATMSTGETNSLIVGGAEVRGSMQGMGGADTSTPPQRIDEFAMFTRVLSAYTIGTLYWETKFYQGLLDEAPAVPKKIIFDNDGCADTDNLYALALVLGADRMGRVSLEGVVDTDGNGVSTAMYRQMLDQAGLKGVPVSVPSQFGVASGGICLAANINAYDAATGSTTAQLTSAYESAAAMYRTILAANPTTAVSIILGGSFRGVADLMQSPADAISSMTGAQLVARDAANGGAIFAQGLGANITFSGDNSLEDWTAGQYVVENNGNLPIVWYGGVPQQSGPGILATRTEVDPLFLMATSHGTDTRQAYDSLPAAAVLSSQFSLGMKVEISGAGEGYGDSTAFSSSGGGSGCSVSGVMLSVAGIPATIEPDFNAALYPYTGVGAGCSSVPAIQLVSPTGTGVVLTASSTASCGTVTITGKHAGTTSTATCSQHYFLPYSTWADRGSPQIFEWFLNSVIDPPPE